MVSLKVLASPGTKAGEGGTATATLPPKETAIFDLSIFIFNSNGDVIGFTTQDFSDGKPAAVVVKTRKATGCSVYVVANAKTLNKGTSPFDGVSTLSVFQAKYLSFTDAKALDNASCLLMMGVSSNFDTSSASSASPAIITLKRLASRIDYTITVKNDKTTGFPIVVDSYQLCNVPTSTLYQQSDFTSPSMPSSTVFANFDKVPTSISSGAAATSPTSAGPYYVYANADPDPDYSKGTYLDIQAHSEVQGAGGTKYTVWKSNFKVEMPGKQVLPNYHYKIDIVINGSVEGKNGGVITKYEAYPYFSGSTLNPWQSETDRNLDLQ